MMVYRLVRDFSCQSIWSPYQRDQKHHVEMVQRRSARFVTNRYRNTSSVTDMLDYLGWESHETRRSKLQLIVLLCTDWLIYHPQTTWHRLIPGLDRHTSTSISSTLHLQIVSSTAFSRGQSHSGTYYHQQKLRLPPLYPSRGSCLT